MKTNIEHKLSLFGRDIIFLKREYGEEREKGYVIWINNWYHGESSLFLVIYKAFKQFFKE